MARPAVARARHGHVALWRSSVARDDETVVDAVDSLLEMEGDAKVPDARTKFISIKQVTHRYDTTNPAPYEEATHRPDTGYHGTTLEIALLFLEDDRTQDQGVGKVPRIEPDFTGQDNRAAGIARLRDWQRQDQSIRGRFRDGRMGFRCDYRPEFNLKPDNNGGYKIISFETFTSLETPYWTTGYLTIQYSGYPGAAPDDPAHNGLGNSYTERQTSLSLPIQG